MTPDPHDLLRLALATAQEAGRLLLDGRPADLGISAKSTPTDLVTEMDTASERLLTGRLLGARPDDGILGEEGTRGAGTSGVRWVLDPIDGTTNYVYGHPFWAVSVAVEYDGQAVAGVVHAPALGETFAAALGAGATLNGAPIAVRPAVPLERALVGTGFGYAAGRRAEQGEVVARLLPRVRDIRRGGSAALDLCYVACGRLDAYYERGVHLWDIAAGALIAAEAGARVGGGGASVAGPDLTLAAAPELYAAVGAALERPVPPGVDRGCGG